MKKMKLKLSPMLFFMALIMIFFGYGFECVSYFIAIIMHEMSHAEVSKRLGYSLTDIKLMPYGASLTGAFEGVKWQDEVLIAIAGPISNVFIAIVFIAVWWLIPVTYFFTEIFVLSNLFTAVFNILPIFPLDGGRTLLALMSKKMPRQKAYKIVRVFGYILGAVFILLFVVSMFYKINFSLAIISLFLLSSTIIPDKNSHYQRLYSLAFRSRKIELGLPVKEIMVFGENSIMSLIRMLNSNFYHRFIIVDKNLKTIATISETQLEELSTKFSQDFSIIDAIRRK